MSIYLNVGATLDGKPVPTKKALKAAVAERNPGLVFYTTAVAFDGDLRFTLDQFPARKVLSVVGPDPYRTRNWYASVEPKGVDGYKVS